jgi:DNA-binding LacI/PurR family transcriptional regulator
MARPGRPVTIRQVALNAGVSRQTASTVLDAPHRADPLIRLPGPGVALGGAGVCYRPVTLRYHVDRSRNAFAGRAGATGRNIDRTRGWKTGRTTLDLPSDRLALADADTVEAGGAAVRVLLDTEVPPDAVIAVTDPVAVGVLREARRQGLRPGTDVAVTGSDDSPPASDVDGGLTSVRQPVERFARTVVDLLDSANGDRGVLPPAEIISRGSAPIRLTEQDVKLMGVR